MYQRSVPSAYSPIAGTTQNRTRRYRNTQDLTRKLNLINQPSKILQDEVSEVGGEGEGEGREGGEERRGKGGGGQGEGMKAATPTLAHVTYFVVPYTNRPIIRTAPNKVVHDSHSIHSLCVSCPIVKFSILLLAYKVRKVHHDTNLPPLQARAQTPTTHLYVTEYLHTLA